MSKIVEENYSTGHLHEVKIELNRAIGQYKRYNNDVKIGITGRPPQERFNEHLRNDHWERMVVIYRSTSIRYVNEIEAYLCEKHGNSLFNIRGGGGASHMPIGGYNFVYALLR